LCSAAERVLWARFSVFAGGFDLEAAEEVCADSEVPAGSVLDLLSALVDKSIILADSSNGRVRYQLTDTLREYGREQLLASGVPGDLQRRHRDWCAALVARIEADWFGQQQVDLLARLKIEHANLRVALDYCLTEPGEARVGLEMVSSLRFYWVISYRLNEGRHWLDRLLAADPDPSPVRLKALCVAAYLAALLNDRPDAESRIDEAGLLTRQLGEESAGSAQVTQLRGLLALYRSDPERAVAYFEQALTAHQSVGDQPAAVYDQAQLALAAALLGDDQRAVALLQECISVTEARGEHWVRGLALWALGIESCRQGDYERATISQRQAMRLRLPLDDRLGVSVNMQVLAWAAAGSGDSERAARLFGAAKTIAEAVGFTPTALGHLSDLHDQHKARARRDLGDTAFDRAFAHGGELGFDDAVGYALGSAGGPDARPPATKRDAAEAGTLTRREREIAELIRQGLSNKEIASTLMISQRTAEGHVEHILTKLGFTTRAQVAAWVTEQRPGSAGG
jgi:non-specific serine/threonine protein kinase